MVKISSVQKVPLILCTILQVAEVNVSQGEVGIAVSPKTCLKIAMFISKEY